MTNHFDGSTTPPRRRESDHSYEDPSIAEALSYALGEKKFENQRRLDRRLLWLYAFCSAAAILLTFLVSRQVTTANHDRLTFQKQIVANCVLNRQNTQSLNAFVDKVIQGYASSTVLPDNEKAARITLMEGAKVQVPTCPPPG